MDKEDETLKITDDIFLHVTPNSNPDAYYHCALLNTSIHYSGWNLMVYEDGNGEQKLAANYSGVGFLLVETYQQILTILAENEQKIIEFLKSVP